MIALHRFGGVYVDVDVMVARDIRHLVANDCEWSAAAARFYNNHVIVLRRGSPTAEFLVRAIAKYPWTNPKVWPVRPRTGIHDWAYNDGITQYCLSQRARCLLFMLPIFMVDQLENWCGGAVGKYHRIGCAVPAGKKGPNTRKDLALSTQLFALHRSVPKKSGCNTSAAALGIFWDGRTPDSVVFAGVYRAMACDGDQGRACPPQPPVSLRKLLLGEEDCQ
jgi:hypothetical protein